MDFLSNQKDAEVFVRAWTLSDTVVEVALRLRLPPRRVCQCARRLRRMGVKLKHMPPFFNILKALPHLVLPLDRRRFSAN